MPNEITALEGQLASLKKKQLEEVKKAQLKGEIKAFQKQERIKQFDKKHPVFATIGRLGSGAGHVIGQVGKKIATPPTAKQQKAMNASQKKLKELLSSNL